MLQRFVIEVQARTNPVCSALAPHTCPGETRGATPKHAPIKVRNGHSNRVFRLIGNPEKGAERVIGARGLIDLNLVIKGTAGSNEAPWLRASLCIRDGRCIAARYRHKLE
jgi:hypothetical protein